MHLRLLVTNQLISYFSVITSPAATTATMVGTAINTVNTATGTTTPSLITDVLLSSFVSNPLMVGTAWMISSAIFTTYSTTKFIKYKKPFVTENSDVLRPQNPIWIQQQRFMERIRPLKKRMQQYTLIRNRLLSTTPRYGTSNSLQQNSIIQQQQQRQSQREITPIGSSKSILSSSSILTMYRFAGSLLFGLLFTASSSSDTISTTIQQRLYDTISIIPVLLIPSICLFIANFSNTIALDRIGIGLTYTSKCGIPIITVLLTLLLDGAQALPTLPTLLSLIPIAFGIAAASWSAPTYELLGFIMACISATAQSALNVTSKRAFAKAKLSGPIGQRTMVAVGLLFTVTINIIQIVMTNMQLKRKTLSNSSSNDATLEDKLPTKNVDTPPIWLTFMAMVAYHVEYLLSFIFVTLVGPITYGTCDAIRRLCIILFGRIFFGGDPFTKMNKIGIATALLGALCYSIVNSK